MPKLSIRWGAVLIVLTLLGAWADEAAEQGRAVLAGNKDAVITVRIVTSMSVGGQQRESESEATGTVIDSSGLAVLSLSAVDPSIMLERFREMGQEMTSKIADLKMVLGDGSEVPAEIVLRDRDLDLAFLRPTEPRAAPMAHVNLDNAGAPQLLDQLAILAQLGQVARRTHSVFLERIEAIIDKPRTFYVPGSHRARDVWCSPAFTLEGKFVGIGVMRTIKTRAGGGGMGDSLIVLVPAEDIREASKQVPPVGQKAPEAQPAEPAPAPEGAAPTQEQAPQPEPEAPTEGEGTGTLPAEA